MKKCKHEMYYWENQYGHNKNIYVIRVCRLCKLKEKGKIGKFKDITKGEWASWVGLHGRNVWGKD